MLYILQLFSNPIRKDILKYVIIVTSCLFIGFFYGTYSEKNKQLLQAVKVARDISKEKEKIYQRNNQILALKETEIVKMSKDNAELRGKLKQNEKHINSTNVIRNNWVRSFEPTYKQRLPKATPAATHQESASDELRTVPAAAASQYVIYLREQYATCQIERNALIDAVK